MSSVKIILRSDKVNANNEHPLYLRITKDRNTRYISLSMSLRPDQWDEANSRVKKSYPNSSRYNAFIAQKVAEAQTLVVDLETRSKHIGSHNIKNAIIGKELPDFFKYADVYIDGLLTSGKISTYKRAKSVKSKCREFWGAGSLHFDQITPIFLREFQNHLLGKIKNAPNTVHGNFRLIRMIINAAIRDELVPETVNPFKRFSMKSVPTQREFLTEDELHKIEDLVLPVHQGINLHRNMYVFAAYAGGLRISDILLLRQHNFDGERITITIHKTKSTLSFKLPSKALEIIHLYDNPKADFNDFIFPALHLSPEDSDPSNIHRAISGATAYANKNLRTIARLAEIDKKISTHTARHTFATRALRKGIRMEYVSKIMGHASIKQTQVYAKIVNADLDKAMEIFD